MSDFDSLAISFGFTALIIAAVCFIICICESAKEALKQNSPTFNPMVNSPPASPASRATRDFVVINFDEIINQQTTEHEIQRTNKIPSEFLNIKPQDEIFGWRQGMGPSKLPLDERILWNDKPLL